MRLAAFRKRLKNREVRKEKCTITTHENLSVKIDYISIVFETTTAEDVISTF